MNQQKTVESRVLSILKDCPRARFDDMILVMHYYNRYATYLRAGELPLNDLAFNYKVYGLPCFETIRRARQRVQSLFPEYSRSADPDDDSMVRTNQSLAEISQQIENGKGAIINVDHRVLNKQRDVTAMNPVGTDHALTITGIEKDAAGNAIGLWIHDTGVCSNMGNAFYCNAQDYAVWKSTPNCTVQYVSKK